MTLLVSLIIIGIFHLCRHWTEIVGGSADAAAIGNREKTKQLEAEVILNKLSAKEHEKMKQELEEFATTELYTQ